MSSLLINYLVIQCHYLVSMESMSFQHVVLAVLAKHLRVVALLSVSTEIKADTVLQLAFFG